MTDVTGTGKSDAWQTVAAERAGEVSAALNYGDEALNDAIDAALAADREHEVRFGVEALLCESETAGWSARDILRERGWAGQSDAVTVAADYARYAVKEAQGLMARTSDAQLVGHLARTYTYYLVAVAAAEVYFAEVRYARNAEA